MIGKLRRTFLQLQLSVSDWFIFDQSERGIYKKVSIMGQIKDSLWVLVFESKNKIFLSVQIESLRGDLLIKFSKRVNMILFDLPLKI